MRRHWKTLAVLAVLTPASPLPAATIFTDRAAFNVAAPGLPVEGFEAGRVDASNAALYPGPLSRRSDNDAFKPGEILPGFSLSSFRGAFSTLGIVGNGAFGSDSVELWLVASEADAAIAFNPGVSAFGIDLLPFNGAVGSWTVEVFGATGPIETTTLPTGGFFGITSNELILNVVIDQPDVERGFYDNLTFGEPIPEPATVGLLSLAGLLVRTRRTS